MDSSSSIVIKVGRRFIVKEGSGPRVRYKVYLPSKWNNLWEQLRLDNKKVEVLIIVNLTNDKRS